MLSFVKSIIGAKSDTTSDSEEVEETTARNHLKTSEENLNKSSEVPAAELANKDNHLAYTPKNAIDSADHSNNILLGSLYSVKGLHFECLMKRCTTTIDSMSLRFVETQAGVIQLQNVSFSLGRISMIRQHLPDAFQFLGRDVSDGAEEFGFQLENPETALKFRKNLYISILELCVPIAEIECALAEYDAVNKEFVLITRAALAQIVRREANDDHFVVFSDSTEREKSLRIIFIESLTRDLQIWPSPHTNQITFWAVRFDKVENTKRMFLMEANPQSVDSSRISEFFESFAVILQDKSFIPLSSKLSSMQGKVCHDESEMMEDDKFVVDSEKDEGYRRKFKERRSSKYSVDEAVSSNRSSEDSVEYEAPYKYAQDAKDENLFHRFMEVGKNRTFVCRGNQVCPQSYREPRKDADKVNIKIYKRDEEDGMLSAIGAIDGSKFSFQGRTFIPGKSLLHQQESKLLLAPENNEMGDVYMMDLERETIMQHWTAGDEKIETLFPTKKQSQLTVEPTFLCTNNKNIFMMDTRLPQFSAKSLSFSYKTNPQIAVGASDSSGHILLGSRLGELRLFDGKESVSSKGFKRAKTLLETIKEPINAVDVTRDGSWILATTKTFLVTFPTKLSNSNKTGFEISLGQNKPKPYYLLLSADDVVKYGITDINFAPAHFDADEECIVTSTGNMAVVWDFESVKRGMPFYSVQFAETTIKDVQIPIDSSDVVVAYPTAVGLFETEKKVL